VYVNLLVHFLIIVGYIINSVKAKGGISVDNTHEFVEKLQEQQKKQEKNEKRQAKGNQSKKLPTKYH
jgi:hypothetical protein